MPETDADPGRGLLDFGVQFEFHLSGIREELKRISDRQNRAERTGLAARPRQIPLVQQSTNATSVDFLDFGGPQPGRIWEVRTLSVISATGAGFVAMATTPTTWYVGQKLPGNAAGILPLSMVRWQFASVPAFEDFSGDTILIRANEKLMAGLTGIPAAPTQISVLAVVDDLPAFVGGVEATI